jgi:hypothetical protein
MAGTGQESDSYSKAETERRAEATLRRMLATPHKPHEPLKGKRRG